MGTEINKEQIKKRLKEANVYEENMTEDLMVDLYKAIMNSETSLQEESGGQETEMPTEAEKSLNESANELMEAISNSECVAPSKKGHYVIKTDDDDDSLDAFSQDILVKPKPASKQAKQMQAEANNNNNNNSIHLDNKHEKGGNHQVLDIRDISIGFNDMPNNPQREQDTLKIISHELKFINIQNSRKFLTANSETRIKMLSDYHLAAAKLKAHYASLSSNMVPIGKAITAIDHDICINPVLSSLKEEDNMLQSSEVTYISRSGRLTKRKMYNEFPDLSQELFGTTSNKKTKNDSDWKSTTKSVKSNSKKEETNGNNNCVSEKAPISKPHTKITRSESPDSSQDVTTFTGFIDQFDELKEGGAATQQRPRSYQRKRPSNDDIISRSSLFRDVSSPRSGRSEAIFNAAKEKAEKTRQQEEEMARFTSTLVSSDSQTLDDEESERIIVDDDDDEDERVEEEEVPEKRRVTPAVPSSRKPIHGRKRGGGGSPAALNVSAKRPHLSGEEVNSSAIAVNGVTSRRALMAKRSVNNNEANRGEPSSSSGPRGKKNVQMTPCPLCSVSFPQKDIEEHAATCGEDMFPQTAQPKRITCEVCDTIVPFSTDYEVHVKACIAKKNSGGLE